MDILTPHFLKQVAKEGTCLLHLTSDIYQPDSIWIEANNSVAEEIPLELLAKYLKHWQPYELPIDVLGLALPKSMAIGKVFSN